MSAPRIPRPSERRATPRLCAEPGCGRQPANHHAYCARHEREALHAFLDEARASA